MRYRDCTCAKDPPRKATQKWLIPSFNYYQEIRNKYILIPHNSSQNSQLFSKYKMSKGHRSYMNGLVHLHLVRLVEVKSLQRCELSPPDGHMSLDIFPCLPPVHTLGTKHTPNDHPNNSRHNDNSHHHRIRNYSYQQKYNCGSCCCIHGPATDRPAITEEGR